MDADALALHCEGEAHQSVVAKLGLVDAKLELVDAKLELVDSKVGLVDTAVPEVFDDGQIKYEKFSE